MTDLRAGVENLIQARRLLEPGQSVLVGVSGGADSMVLMSVLDELAPKYGWRLAVAHFNHRLRGRASNSDEAFVKTAARALGLECVSEQGEVRRFASEQKLSLEMAARKLRHDFFARTCKRLGFSSIALAHHADDQIELFFLRLLRGAGGEGLAGMDWISPSPSDPAIRLVRPFLSVPKEELRAYAKQQGLRFREDASNAHLEHQRNRIRHELLPLLKTQYQPALARVISRVMDIVGSESDFVSKCVRECISDNGIEFAHLHLAVQRRILQLGLAKLGVPPEFDLIETLRGSEGQIVTVSPKLAVWRDANGKIHSREAMRCDFGTGGIAVDLVGKGGSAGFAGLEITWQIRSWSKALTKFTPLPGCCEVFDARQVGSPIFLRHWRPGDRFQPIGMKSPVKVQDLFANAKVPRGRRHESVLATTAEDEVFWIEGLRISERFKVSTRTESSLKWEWRRPN